jgi:hypothetical protein
MCRYLDSIQSKVTDEIACEKQCSFNEDFICRSFAFYTSGRFGLATFKKIIQSINKGYCNKISL